MIKYFFLTTCMLAMLFAKNIDKTIGSTLIAGLMV